jgi:hypothetical protein
MTDIIVTRWNQPDCTLGRLTYGGFKCFTLELPWKDNASNVSCFPPGRYKAEKKISPKNGACVQLLDVPNRTGIQIHAGNYTRQIQGCILVGESITHLDADGTPDVVNSKATLAKLLALLPDTFYINVS